MINGFEAIKRNAEAALAKEYDAPAKDWDEAFARMVEQFNAERALEVLEIVKQLTEEEVAFLKALKNTVLFTGNPGKAKPIKVRYNLSWNEVKKIILAL